jgi:hypothetical protein
MPGGSVHDLDNIWSHPIKSHHCHKWRHHGSLFEFGRSYHSAAGDFSEFLNAGLKKKGLTTRGR